VPRAETGAQLLFQFCSALHRCVSLIVTTNLPFAKWTQVFRDETMTNALVDRLTHSGHVSEFVGESFRFKQRDGPNAFVTSACRGRSLMS